MSKLSFARLSYIFMLCSLVAFHIVSVFLVYLCNPGLRLDAIKCVLAVTASWLCLLFIHANVLLSKSKKWGKYKLSCVSLYVICKGISQQGGYSIGVTHCVRHVLYRVLGDLIAKYCKKKYPQHFSVIYCIHSFSLVIVRSKSSVMVYGRIANKGYMLILACLSSSN